jgi:putative FMN-dependent luciferase-like monooxygenase
VTALRLGFFTRLLDDGSAADRYRMATEQIVRAEQCGYESAWIAQHHFHEHEGGLPSPFVFLAQVAARTQRIRLGTGVVTLPMEHPVRAAEDAAVLDLMSGGRLEVGVGPGGTPASFAAFGVEAAERGAVFARHLRTVLDAWRDQPLGSAENRMYPAGGGLPGRVWQATFSVEGGARAGAAGDGLMLSRTQPRTAERPDATLADIQDPIVDAYLAALPKGVAPRILASRSVFAADDRAEALRYADRGVRVFLERFGGPGRPPADAPLADLIAMTDIHIGTPAEVVASLRTDRVLARSTDLAVQVHPVDPPHRLTLRSIELVAEQVAPALGWVSPLQAPRLARRTSA